MRWVFFSLLILNVVYLVFSLIMRAAPEPQRALVAVPAAAPATLVLLEESVAAPRGAPAEAGMPALCPVVGPWEQLGLADQAARSLQGSGYKARVESLRVARDRLHWVYLPAVQNKEQALRVLRELQAKGVDSFIVAEGADANAISLGYFSSADSARGLMIKMQTSGYPADVRQTAKEATEYWLRIDAATIKDEGSALRALIAANLGISGDHAACEPVLSVPALTSEENLSAEQ
jgi:hypothetical protein